MGIFTMNLADGWTRVWKSIRTELAIQLNMA